MVTFAAMFISGRFIGFLISNAEFVLIQKITESTFCFFNVR